MNTITVARRFCGPPGSANGGYFAGLVSSLRSGTSTVRLIKPPPLDVPMEVREGSGEQTEILYQGEPIGRAQPGALDLTAPPVPDYVQAVEASRHYAGFTRHAFPGCFVCGPERARGDGLRIFAGPLGTAGDPSMVAAPWVPDASLDAGDGKVRPEFMWAALDCPGFAVATPEMDALLLGEFTAHADRRVRIEIPCIVVGWRISHSGRKHVVGTALYDGDGELCARARAVWIAPRPA